MSAPAHDLASLGRTLRARRHTCGLTLEQLATLCGISAAQISRIETGRSAPSYPTLLRLHQSLGLEPTEPSSIPVSRPAPEDGLLPRLGALLSVRRTLSLGEASTILDASIAGIREAAHTLAERLVPVGMFVVEDSERLGLVPYHAFAGLADRATPTGTAPRLGASHVEVVSILVHSGATTRKRIDELRGVASVVELRQRMSQFVEQRGLSDEATAS